MSLKRFPIVNIMFHVRWIDRIGNETHRVNEFLKSIILKGWLAAFSSTVEGKNQLYTPSRVLSILEIQLGICAQRNAGNSCFAARKLLEFFKFDIQVGWTNIILLSFHLQTYCTREKVSSLLNEELSI